MVWSFIQNQVLGMQWLNALIGGILTAVGLDTQTRVGGSVQFFLYDVLKITVLFVPADLCDLLCAELFSAGTQQENYGTLSGIWANCMAALLGTVTPFCSCSSIPLFIGFTSAGLPLGRDVFLPDLLAHGGFGEPRAAHEHLWRTGCNRLCAAGAAGRGGGRHAD